MIFPIDISNFDALIFCLMKTEAEAAEPIENQNRTK